MSDEPIDLDEERKRRGERKRDRGRSRRRKDGEVRTPPAAEGMADVPAGLTVYSHQFPFLIVTKGTEEYRPGVYRRMQKEDKQNPGRFETKWDWFCSPLLIEAETRDVRGEQWGRLLVVYDRDAQRHDWAMPMAMLAGDGTGYREQLLSLGLVMKPGKWARDALHEYISGWRPEVRARCVDRTGWHGSTCFVLPDETFGSFDDEKVILQITGTAPTYELGGSLEGWQAEVNAKAIGNSRLILAISAALAGPLLEPLGEESGGFHLSGGSSQGKSTALAVAASVWGCAVHSWRATDNAAETMALGASDALLALDEISQAEGKTVDALAYMLANGSGKARMRRDTTARPVTTWRTLFLSTGETGLADKMAEAGKRARAGQEVRVVEVPADAGRGLGLFEDLHGDMPAADFARALRASAEAHRGHVARAFLARLVQDLDGHVAAARAYREAWLRDHLPKDAHGQVARVAGRFALAAAAGELAAELLDWGTGTAEQAAARCFRAWLAARGGSGAAEIRDGLAQVRAFLEQHGSSRFEAAWRADERGVVVHTQNRCGFRQGVEREDLEMEVDGTGNARRPRDWTFYVLSEAWKRELCKGFDADAIAREMVAHGWLAAGGGRNHARKVSIPGHGRPRVYTILPAFLSAGPEDGEA